MPGGLAARLQQSSPGERHPHTSPPRFVSALYSGVLCMPPTLMSQTARLTARAYFRPGGQNGHMECLRALGMLGAEATMTKETADGTTPAHLAAENGNDDCIRMVLILFSSRWQRITGDHLRARLAH